MNRLSQSISPYLRQHAENPVDWYPWGEEALTAARTGEKVIFLSIGYAACHWCHVMARESFEDPDTAVVMNANFINIKVDREERPDLDSIYMTATMAMTGSGGWPMSVFLTPDLKPFYCGTYFPPQRRFNLPSFREILEAIASAWINDRENIHAVGGNVFDHINQVGTNSSRSNKLSISLLETAEDNLRQSFDWGFGGWGQAPKFPQSMVIEYLLRRGGEEALKAAGHTLSSMARGGMYDVVGGGFARYSTDHLWRVPHFEKMLYDNAQLAMVYLHGWQVSGNPAYRKVVEETLAFISREMTSPEGGFYSSLDADSEHEEGKYYVWSYKEIEVILSEDFDLFKAAYGLTEQGNWEGKIVLQRALEDATLAARFGLSSETEEPQEMIAARISTCHTKLLAERNTRIRPGTDDKILTSWNAWMLAAFGQAARAFWGTSQGDEYHQIAMRNARFLLSNLFQENRLHRSWREGHSSREVFLEDYAGLILALLELYQTDFDNSWYAHALDLTEEMVTLFNDPEGGFFDTTADEENILFRPKDLQDNATPCGNSMACEALLKMAAFSDRSDFRQKAEKMLEVVAEQAVRYPTGFARWLSAMDFAMANVKQVAIIGGPAPEDTQSMLEIPRKGYFPNWVVAASSLPLPEKAPGLLMDRPLIGGKTTAYVCESFVCRQPVTEVKPLLDQLNQ